MGKIDIQIGQQLNSDIEIRDFKMLFSLSQDLMCTASFEGYFKQVNPAFEKTLGYPAADLVSFPFVDLVHPDDRVATIAETKKLASGKPTISFENRYRCKDGSYIWLAWKSTPSFDDGMIYAVARDITGEKHEDEERERRIIQQDARLAIGRAIQEMTRPADMGNVVKACAEQLRQAGLDFQAIAIHRMLRESDLIFETYEVTPSGQFNRREMPHSNVYRMWQEGASHYRSNLQQNMGGMTEKGLADLNQRYGATIQCILDVPHCRGTLALMSDRANAYSEDDIAFVEQIAQVLSIGITRAEDLENLQKQNEELRIARDTLEATVDERTTELRRANEHLQTIIEHLPCGIILIDEDRQAIMANQAGEHAVNVLADGSASLLNLGTHTIEEILFNTKKTPLEITLEGPEPQIFQIESVPFQQSGYVLIVRDITRERQVQERIKKQDHLAAVGQLAAGIAHDFNNLLTVMMGVPQILNMRDDLPEDIKGELNNIYDQGLRASQLVRQVLDFSRAQKAEHQPIDLAPFLKESIKLLERTFPTQIRIQADCLSCPVQANPTQLQQVLTNLAINARDAMPEGGKLRISLAPLHIPADGESPLPEMPTGDWAVWSVSDTGTGIPPEVIDHIFEPFFTTKKREHGTGLGLSQVYGIIQQHNGYIDVVSQPGEGTTFIIYLPLTAGTENQGTIARYTIPRGQGQTILVAEDKPAVCKVVTGLLKALNYQVRTAGDGHTALLLYTEHSDIDLVLADYMLPDITGNRLFEELKKNDPAIRFILMTGSSTSDGSPILVPKGVSGNIKKPLILIEIAQAIRDALT